MVRYPWIRLFLIPLAMAVPLWFPFVTWPLRPAITFIAATVVVWFAFRKNRTELSLAICALVWFVFGYICAFFLLPIVLLALPLQLAHLFIPSVSVLFWMIGIAYWFMWPQLEMYLPARLRSAH